MSSKFIEIPDYPIVKEMKVNLRVIIVSDFSSFKSLILENYLPMRIFELAIHDKDSIVRASAIKCLQEMAKVDDFWNYVMQSYDIYVSTTLSF